MTKINYRPAPTIKKFMTDHRPGQLFYNWIVGPVGSGKTTGLFFKLAYMAAQQAPGPDGVRRTKAVVVRNTAPQLRDTTLASWNYWFKDGVAGEWKETSKVFTLRYNDVECEVLFRPLDTPDDVARVLSLEVTFAIIDEFVQIPREIVDALSARCGRYPNAAMGGATNWGMWGSSNPDTEDNWWHDYLHHNPDVERVDITKPNPKPGSIRFFVQPSGLSPEAENLEYLPGGRKYYEDQIKGKSEAWIKQFIEAEWGFSIAGKPVVAMFRSDQHVARRTLQYNPHLPLIVGFDPGLTGSALVFGQEDLHGRLLVLGELVQSNVGAARLATELMKPYVRKRWGPGAVSNIIVAPDPAAANRSQADEKSVVDEFRKHFKVSVESNNRLPLRIDAIDSFATRLTEMGPALQIDPRECPHLIRALRGGWRYAIDPKREVAKSPEPEKNAYSHVGDAFGYLSRYFHRQNERTTRSGVGRTAFKPPQFKNLYTFG